MPRQGAAPPHDRIHDVFSQGFQLTINPAGKSTLPEWLAMDFSGTYSASSLNALLTSSTRQVPEVGKSRPCRGRRRRGIRFLHV